MGTPAPNVSRNTFDANKGYHNVALQQGVPITDADWNELQHIAEWRSYRSLDTLMGFDTSEVTVPDAMYEFITPVDPSKTWPADAPAVAATPESWFPGSMRPWVHTAGLVNDLYVMWGPSWVNGLFVEDTDQRGPAGLYSDTGHIITHGTVTAIPGGTTFEDDSKDFTPLSGSLHLIAPAGGVGNGTNRHCRVYFTTGAEAGNAYEIAAVPTSDRITVTGPYLAGGPVPGDEYIVLPNTITFVTGQVEKVWLCIWSEDQDMEEDPDLEDPIMLLEPSHRAKIRYWLRILRSGVNLPSSATRPDFADLPPQTHTERVFWVHVATITPGVGAPTVVPADIVYATPKHYELPPIAPLLQALKSKIDLSTGLWTDLRFRDDVGPGATLVADRHPVIRTSAQGIRFPAAPSGDDVSSVIAMKWWDGASSFPLFDVLGWYDTTFASGWGSAIFSNALISKSNLAGSDAQLYLGVTAEEVTTSLSNFMSFLDANPKAWIRMFADDAGASADFLATLSLNANFSQDGATIGHLHFKLDPNDGNNLLHEFRFNLERDVGPDVAMSYLMDLESPANVTNGYAGLRIAGISGTGSHPTLGQVALQVVAGDVIFGALATPFLSFDYSSGNWLLRSSVGGIGLALTGATDIALLGVPGDTYAQVDDPNKTVTIKADTLIDLDGPVSARESITLSNTKRYGFSGVRIKRRTYYMDHWNANIPAGGEDFGNWIPGGVPPVLATYEINTPTGSADLWPCAEYANSGSDPRSGFYRVELLPGESLIQVTLGVDSLVLEAWDLKVYTIDPDGSITLISTDVGVIATGPAGSLKTAVFTLSTPVESSGTSPKDVLLEVIYTGTTDRHLYWIRTKLEVESVEEAAGIFDS